ncbi:ABC transporter substrate-binding protein [Gimesia algae]|uniref:Bacterial extracellular solute-binding protein, family 5 Middle n=1 Tax=Gimesia algae TaxID=2527971 RepID=A0A517VFX7_9PLAN|nr:ABC transporter substrate-binding protein [Gimesia algae]QDT91837.1 Bacterial extracellular solute-binding protein, family 5 Middle [Gimesia algae]
MRTLRDLLLILSVLIGFCLTVDLNFVVAQNDAKKNSKPDAAKNESKDSASEEVEILPKLEEMQIPTVEQLLKKPPVDWIVLENDTVLIVEPIYPRPDTLGQLDLALKESYNWPKPKSKEEIEEQKKMRAEMNFVRITLINDKENPEYRIQRKSIKQVIHHEDQIINRIDLLLKEKDLKTAFELLLILDRKHRDWPGFEQRQNQLLLLEAKDKQNSQQYLNALAYVQDLHSRDPEFPGLSNLAGEIIDVMISQSVQEKAYRKAHYYLKRLESMFPRQETVSKWKTAFLNESNSLLKAAEQAASQKHYQEAIQVVSTAVVVWPANPKLRESLLKYQKRFPMINVGVLETALEETPYFLGCEATRRHQALTQIPLFEVTKVDQTPYYHSRFLEQWEPTDLGRRADFILRQSYSSWESHPTMIAADITKYLRGKLTPGTAEYNERFDSYVRSVSSTGPFTFSIYFDRVPLQIEWLLSDPVNSPPLWQNISTISESAQSPTGNAVLVSSRFVVDHQQDGIVSYSRAVPQPSDVRDFSVAQINEIPYPSFEKSFQGLLLGEVTVLPFLPAKLVSFFKDSKDFNVVQSAIPLTHVLQFNPESKPMQVVELRRALAYAIDRQKILSETLLHESRLLNGRLITAPYYTGLQVYNQQVPQREYSFPLAVALAVASQKKLGGQFPTLRMLCDSNPEAQAAAQEMIKAWSQIGLKVVLIPNTAEEAKKENLQWDIVYRTVAMTEPVMELWPFLTVGKGAQIESLEILPDWMRLSLIELDEATDWESATALIKKLQQQLYSMAHIIPLWEIDQFHVFRKNIKGYADRPLNFYDNVEQWIPEPYYPDVEAFTQK